LTLNPKTILTKIYSPSSVELLQIPPVNGDAGAKTTYEKGNVLHSIEKLIKPKSTEPSGHTTDVRKKIFRFLPEWERIKEFLSKSLGWGWDREGCGSGTSSAFATSR